MFANRFKHIFIILLGSYSFLNILVLNGDRLFDVAMEWYHLMAVVFALVYAIWFGNYGIQKFFPAQQGKIHPLVFQFALSIFLMLVISAISVFTTSSLLGDPFTSSLINFKLTFGFTFRVNLFLNTVNAIYFFNSKFKEKEVETEKLKTLSSQARFEVLSNQINPHFLFNSLNVLASLVHKDADQADIFIQKLSSVYRYVLKNRNNELVTLEEELTFARNYLDLLRVRFGEALIVEMNLHYNKGNLNLPPAVLQLLIENVIKHNTVSPTNPIIIRLEVGNDFISVSNNLVPKKVEKEPSGIGLKNIFERYEFFNQSIEISHTTKEYKVVLPLIKL